MAARRSVWIPADRLLAVLDKADSADLDELDARTIRLLRNGEQGYVTLDRADRLLTALDLFHWFHLPKEQGGLADIYEDGVQYGAPNNRNNWKKSNPKHATHEERLAAARERYRLRKLEEAA